MKYFVIMRETLLSLLIGALLCCSTFAADGKPGPATLDELKSAVADVMTRYRKTTASGLHS